MFKKELQEKFIKYMNKKLIIENHELVELLTTVFCSDEKLNNKEIEIVKEIEYEISLK